jgi:hypothetical protein
LFFRDHLCQHHMEEFGRTYIIQLKNKNKAR